jgi:predicted nucleotidyltransferase
VAKLLCDDTLLPGLKEGLSYPAALEQAVAQSLPHCREALAKPNNILAIQYLRALYRRKSEITPLPVHRQGDYHAGELSPESYPSATAIRHAFLDGRYEDAEAAAGYPLPQEPVCLPDSLDAPLLYRLRGMQPEDIAAYPHCSEGLENRVLACARQTTSREDLLAQLKTRRYPYTRLSRLMSHILLDMRQDVLAAHPESAYVRLLGLRKDAKPLLARLSESSIPIISKPADGNLTDPLYQMDVRAYDLWALGAGLPAGLMFTQSPVIL